MAADLFCIDLGGTEVKYGIVTGEEQVLAAGSCPTPYRDAAHLIELLTALTEESRARARIGGIAVSLPGSASRDEAGTVVRSGAIGYLRGVPLGQALKERTGMPCALENDGRCGTLGEYRAGALRGSHCGVALVIGTSLGGGIVMDGKLIRGRSDFAGRFAHVLTRDRDGCYTGLGRLIGKEGLRRAVVSACGLPADAPLSGYEIFERVERGDKAARRGLDDFCLPIAALISSIQAILDPDTVVIGGGISSRPILLTAIQEQLNRLDQDYFIPRPASRVVLAQLGNQANLIGAAHVWRTRYKEEAAV